MSDSALNRAITKLEAADLTDDEIGSLAEAIAMTLAAGGGDVEGFTIDAATPNPPAFSLNFEEIKVTLRDGFRRPRNIWVVVEAG